jgi:hypothetical protein
MPPTIGTDKRRHADVVAAILTLGYTGGGGNVTPGDVMETWRDFRERVLEVIAEDEAGKRTRTS